MDVLVIAFVLFAAAVHGSLQLALGTQVLSNTHALGARISHGKLLTLNLLYALGYALTVALVLSLLALLATRLGNPDHVSLLRLLAASLGLIGGAAALLFYFRGKKGTRLWLPRGAASYLDKRAQAAGRPSQALLLGVTAVVFELVFGVVPALGAAVGLSSVQTEYLPYLLAAYCLVASAPLILLTILIGGGHKISTLQRWREHNRTFIRTVIGFGMLVIGLYIYIIYVVGSHVYPGGLS